MIKYLKKKFKVQSRNIFHLLRKKEKNLINPVDINLKNDNAIIVWV